MAEFSGKVAIVSGGARGIGRAAARKLAGEGASVVICSDREEQVEETVAALREEGLEVRGVRADVTSSADMKKLMDLAIETYGGVDVLVNSAGVQRYGTVVETEEEVWDEVLDVNLKGVYLASRYAIPEMRKRGGGAIVNLSSVQAFASQTGVAAYTASKGGINALTRAMALDHAGDNIRVNASARPRWTRRCCGGRRICSRGTRASRRPWGTGAGCTRWEGWQDQKRSQRSSPSLPAPGRASSPVGITRSTAAC
jgi:NAD(P)-dependent dehydrogenase (short-subunit alcohol dehydrogenase family)